MSSLEYQVHYLARCMKELIDKSGFKGSAVCGHLSMARQVKFRNMWVKWKRFFCQALRKASLDDLGWDLTNEPSIHFCRAGRVKWWVTTWVSGCLVLKPSAGASVWRELPWLCTPPGWPPWCAFRLAQVIHEVECLLTPWQHLLCFCLICGSIFQVL